MVLKDFNKVETTSPGNWGLELLVEMTLSSAATLLSPANALLRVFEVRIHKLCKVGELIIWYKDGANFSFNSSLKSIPFNFTLILF